MKRARFRRLSWLLSLSCLGACAHEVASRPPPPYPKEPIVQGTAPELIEVRALLVAYQRARGAPDDQKRTRSAALQRAQTLSALAKSGESFPELMREYNDRASTLDLLGKLRVRPAKPAPLPAAVVQAALALSTGDVSAPVELPEGFVIVQRLADPPPGPERIAAKHILISYVGAPKALKGAHRDEAQARALAEQIVREARAPGADWDALAAKYTEEPGSKSTGGDLGHFGRGEMVPAFEQAAFALKVGEVSDVVKSPYGFHVIKRYQ